MIISLLLFLFIVTADDEESSTSHFDFSGLNLSEEVLKHQPTVEKYAKEYGIEDYVNYLLAIMQVESGGTAEDVMQSSESMGLPPNSLSTEESIKQGCKYFSELLKSAESKGCDIDTVVQAYNYGGGFIDYVAGHGKKYTYELAVSFAKEKSGGVKVTYKNEISIKENGGWRYKYGNMFYVRLVKQYLAVPSFSDATAQAIFNEALKYQGWKYVYGGSNPTRPLIAAVWFSGVMERLVSACPVPHRRSMTLPSTCRCHRQKLVTWCSSIPLTMLERM